MHSAYSPVVKHPRTIPWPWHALESVAAAGAAGAMLDAVLLPAAASAIAIMVLLVVVVVIDVWVRSRYIGTGLERSFVQLVVVGFAGLGIAAVILLMPPAPPLAVVVAVMLAVGVAVFAVLRWDQGLQVRRARTIADKRDAAESERD